MRPECQECPHRRELIQLAWDIDASMTGANVHQLANVKTIVNSALDFVRMGHVDCGLCGRAQQRAEEEFKNR